ncbi:MAG: hypothetical protein IT289_06770 [Oligoflexia bacterium]|nr:hypothetical protein [Oligoflexia bacterium]
MSMKNPTLLEEIKYFIREYRKWWLIPLISVFVIFGLLVALAQFAPVVSPFIYTLF